MIRWLGKIDKSQHIQILIPKDKKESILQELQVLGVTNKTLFQDFIGYIDTFDFDTDDKSRCVSLVVRARELIESNKPSYSDAKSMFKEALNYAKSYNRVEEKAYIMHELGYISYRTNAFDEAIKYYDEALEEKKNYLTRDCFSFIYTEVAKGLVYI